MKEPIKVHLNLVPQRVPPANTGFALYMYRQFMSSLCTSAQVCAGTLPAVDTAGTAGICIQVCAGIGTGTGTDFRTGTVKFGKFGTSIPVPENSISPG